MHELTQLIKDDMRPALGVTEPGAIRICGFKSKILRFGRTGTGYAFAEQRYV